MGVSFNLEQRARELIADKKFDMCADGAPADMWLEADIVTVMRKLAIEYANALLRISHQKESIGE